MYILMGIIQFGFIFAVYITMNNAVREGARWGTIYVYDNTVTNTVNDTNRWNGMIDRTIASRGILAMAARGSSTQNFDTSSNGNGTTSQCPTQSPAPSTAHYWGATSANPDVLICYSIPTGVLANDPRRGYYMDVQSYYHLQVFIPLLQQFLPDDPVKGAPWIRLPGVITVVVN